jgi:hypothetical protein
VQLADARAQTAQHQTAMRMNVLFSLSIFFLLGNISLVAAKRTTPGVVSQHECARALCYRRACMMFWPASASAGSNTGDDTQTSGEQRKRGAVHNEISRFWH